MGDGQAEISRRADHVRGPSARVSAELIVFVPQRKRLTEADPSDLRLTAINSLRFRRDLNVLAKVCLRGRRMGPDRTRAL